MKITKANYEAYLLDLIEGRLSTEERAELMAFLEAHPELDADFDILDATLPEDESPEVDKDVLKADGGSPSALDWMMVRALEGDAPELTEFNSDANRKDWLAMKKTKLQPGEARAHLYPLPPEIESPDQLAAAIAEGDLENAFTERLMEDAGFKLEVQQYGKLRLTPSAVTYPNKSSLKRQATVIPLYRRFAVRVGLAAAVLIALFSAFWLTNESSQTARMALNPEQTLDVKRESATVEEQSVEQNTAGTGAMPLPNDSEVQDVYTSPSKSNTANAPQGKRVVSNETPSVSSDVQPREKVTMASLQRRTPSINGAFEAERLLEQGLELPAGGLVAVNLPNLPEDEKPPTINTENWQEVLLGLAKERVLGRPQEEGESFAEALAVRVEEKTDGQVAVAPNGRGDKRFYLRLGSFSIER